MPNPTNKVQLADGTVIMDITDTTAAAADVASGKYFYTADGTKTLGTASGGGGYEWVDELGLSCVNGVVCVTYDDGEVSE